MNYYSQLTNDEILNVLNKYDLLTFNAKVKLKEELSKREKINKNEKIILLDKSIKSFYKKIKNLEFFDKIGYKIKWLDQDSFQVTRSNKAIIIDLLTIFIGFILIFISMIFLLTTFFNYYIDDYQINFFILIISIFSCIQGFRFLNNGLIRFIDNYRFNFFVNKNEIRLTKFMGYKIREFINDTSSVYIEKSYNETFIKSNNIEIFKVSSKNLISKLTLEAIIKKVKFINTNL